MSSTRMTQKKFIEAVKKANNINLYVEIGSQGAFIEASRSELLDIIEGQIDDRPEDMVNAEFTMGTLWIFGK